MLTMRCARLLPGARMLPAAALAACVLGHAGPSRAETLRSVGELEKAAIERELSKLDSSARSLERPLPGRMRSPAIGVRIPNGIGTHEFAASGALLQGGDPRSAQVICSGTLIGCSTFLTAAHCFIPGGRHNDPRAWLFDRPEQFQVYLQHAGIIGVEKILWPGQGEYVHPTTTGGSRADVAVVKLKSPVTGIAPLPVNRGAKPQLGTPGLVVGFGRTGGMNHDYGIKRFGEVSLSACTQTFGANLVCWDYEGLTDTPGKQVNTCNADSGGGLHVGVDAEVAGVTSGGLKPQCTAGDRSYDTDVATYLPWILQAGRDGIGTSACGPLVPVDPTVHVRGDDVELSDNRPEVTHTIEVRPGVAVLRVAMNGVDDLSGRNDFDLFVRRGDGHTVCAEDGPGQFAFCEVADPQPGPWSIVVRRKRGKGLLQLVVTRLPRR